jgi:hypothetical protein
MDGSIVFRKTAKAVAELEQKEGFLGPRIRQLLILVDGTRTVADLGLLLPSLGDPSTVLQGLLLQSYITTDGTKGGVPPAAPSVAPPPPVAAPPVAAPPPVVAAQVAPATLEETHPSLAPPPVAPAAERGLEVAKERLINELRASLGKDAELIVPKIQAVKAVTDLSLMVARLTDIVSTYAGKEVGEAFLQRVRVILAALR